MQFFIDNSLSPRLRDELRSMGHDALHVRDVMIQSAPDDDVFAFAAQESRILLAADTDFGTLLAKRGASKPSVILIRTSRKSTEAVAPLLRANLSALEADLSVGSVVVFEDARLRIRRLPIN
ncbi:MAG: DUF5615 family PIN-like protein [Planctomycetes bacterium]|nr:DUF5615 family PIN-like protein [Planctomycetota bacterium]